MKIWTATTDGDGCDLTTTVHRSEIEALNRVANDLVRDAGCPLSEEQVNVATLLAEQWARWNDGACIIQEHDIGDVT